MLSRWPVRRRVVVNLENGQAFRGILWAKRGPLLVLREAELIEGRTTTPVDGEVLVERPKVAFLQMPSTEA